MVKRGNSDETKGLTADPRERGPTSELEAISGNIYEFEG